MGFFSSELFNKEFETSTFFKCKFLLSNDLEISGSSVLVELFQPEAAKLYDFTF